MAHRYSASRGSGAWIRTRRGHRPRARERSQGPPSDGRPRRSEDSRLLARVVELTKAFLAAQGKDRMALQVVLEGLQAQLEQKNRMLFGQSSERRSGEPTAPPKERKPKTGHGPREQRQPRIVDESHDIPEADRVCILCNGALAELDGQVEESEEIDVIAREFVTKRHVRKKYRCRCGECIETAPLPPRLIPGGRYSLAFAINVAISKYADHLPLERQVRSCSVNM